MKQRGKQIRDILLQENFKTARKRDRYKYESLNALKKTANNYWGKSGIYLCYLSVLEVVWDPADQPLADVRLPEAEGEVRDLLLLALQPEDLAQRAHVQVQEVLLQLLHPWWIEMALPYRPTYLPPGEKVENYCTVLAWCGPVAELWRSRHYTILQYKH